MKTFFILFFVIPIQISFCKEIDSLMEVSLLSKYPIKNIDLNSFQYYYIEKGTGPVIIFLHGFPDYAATWDETIKELSGNYHCIAPFLRGYYPTGIPKDNNYSVKTVAEDIVQLAEKLGHKNYYIVGSDWGASVAYAVANLVPQRVIKVATLGIPHPATFSFSLQTIYAGRHFIKFRNKNESIKAVKKNDFNYLDKLYKRWSPDWITYTETFEMIKKTFSYQGRTEAALGYYWAFFNDRKSSELQQFYKTVPQMPALLFVGKNDNMIGSSIVKQVKKTMPETFKVIVYENAGHFLHQEVHSIFISDLENFFNK